MREILIGYGIWLIVLGTGTFLMTLYTDMIFLPTPHDIYVCTDINWFGCFLVWLLYVIFNPIYAICFFIYRLIYWLFRRDRRK